LRLTRLRFSREPRSGAFPSLARQGHPHICHHVTQHIQFSTASLLQCKRSSIKRPLSPSFVRSLFSASSCRSSSLQTIPPQASSQDSSRGLTGPFHSTITMGLISRSSQKLLTLDALLEPSSCKSIQALRHKYEGSSKLILSPPWSQIGLFHCLPVSGVDHYRKAITQITLLHAPFDIRVGSIFRWQSHSQKSNQVGLNLPSVQLKDLHAQLIRAIESPFRSALRLKLRKSKMTEEAFRELYSDFSGRFVQALQ
jgi:hypothetical protein